MLTDYDASAHRAILREGLAMLAHGLMLPFGFIRSGHRPLRKREIRTLVFVHGMHANRATFFPLQTYLKACGHRRQFAFNHGSGPSVEALAIRLKREIDRNVKGGRIDIIGHSLGGLVARFYLQQLGGSRRVDRLVTIGTPHRGTWASTLVPSAFVWQLKPDGPFIQRLNALPPPPGVACHSFAAESDALIVPRDHALCPFGESRTFSGVGHTGMLLAPSVFSAVRGALRGS